jgi:hypothetical protein
MQMFLLGFIIIEICEIFTVGDFPLNPKVRIVRYPSLKASSGGTMWELETNTSINRPSLASTLE